MEGIDILIYLNGIKDEYVLHAMRINRRRVVNVRRVLIAAVIVILAVVCAISAISDIGMVDRYYESPTTDPVESALNAIDNQIYKDYAVVVEVYGGMIDEEETQRILSLESWQEIIEERGWGSDTFAIVYVEYYIEYNHNLAPYSDGYTAGWLWMEKVESSGKWLYYDGMSGILFRGIFEEDGLGHNRQTKDDVAAYNAATEYLEEHFSDVEICGYKLDYTKALAVIREYPDLAEERDWRWTQIPTYDYTFYVVYAEYYADYEYSAVWLWMEKDLDTGEWSCYKADTDVELEEKFID